VNVTHGFQEALQRAELPRRRFHDLRHAHATLLIEGGVELAVVSRALGHSDLGTTADVYGAWTREMAGTVASRMDDVLRRSASACRMAVRMAVRPESRAPRDLPEGLSHAPIVGRGAAIRTRDLLNPIQVRYQAAPHPDAAKNSRGVEGAGPGVDL